MYMYLSCNSPSLLRTSQRFGHQGKKAIISRDQWNLSLKMMETGWETGNIENQDLILEKRENVDLYQGNKGTGTPSLGRASLFNCSAYPSEPPDKGKVNKHICIRAIVGSHFFKSCCKHWIKILTCYTLTLKKWAHVLKKKGPIWKLKDNFARGPFQIYPRCMVL